MQQGITKDALTLESTFLQTADHPGILGKRRGNNFVAVQDSEGVVAHFRYGFSAVSAVPTPSLPDRDMELATSVNGIDIPENSDADRNTVLIADTEDNRSVGRQVTFDREPEFFFRQLRLIVRCQRDDFGIVIPAESV